MAQQSAHHGDAAFHLSRGDKTVHRVGVLCKISDGADRIEIGIDRHAPGLIPGHDVGVRGGSVADGRIPPVVIVEVEGEQRAMLELAIVGPILGEQVALEGTAVFKNPAPIGRGPALGKGRHGVGLVDENVAPVSVLVVVIATGRIEIARGANAEDVAELLLQRARERGVVAVQAAVGSVSAVFREIVGVTDGDVVRINGGGGAGAFLVDDDRGSGQRRVALLLENLGHERELGAVAEDVIEREKVFLVAGQRPIRLEIPLIVARRQEVIGLAEPARDERAGALEGDALRAIVTVVERQFLIGHGLG